MTRAGSAELGVGEREARLFTRYLLDREPPAALVGRYLTAERTLFAAGAAPPEQPGGGVEKRQGPGMAVPIVCNPYTYIPMLNLGAAGTSTQERQCSLAQLAGVYIRPGGNGGLMQVYYFSYRSLLAYKLLKELPLPHRQGLRMTRFLMPRLGIVGVMHADRPSEEKYCFLERSGEGKPDRLHIDYRLSSRDEVEQSERERGLIRAFRRLGCFAIRRVRPGHGSSIHYAGTLPMRRDGGCGTSPATRGRLRASRAVYVADGSVFPSLPAKGLTFSIMAHADRVGTLLAERLA
jgi:GMC oxidoreductase